MEPEAEFDIPVGWQVESWRLEDSLLLASGDGQLHVFDVTSGESVAFDHPGGSMHVIPSGEGFTVVTEDATSSTCRLARYEWTATTVTDVSFACIRLHGLGGAGVHLSPDGRWIAALTRMLDGDEPASPGDSHDIVALSIFDAATGEEALRVGGALFLGEVLIAGATPWLADSSGLVVGTVAGVQIVDLEDGWAPSPPALSSSTWVLPAPDDASRITLGVSTVADLEGNILARASVEQAESWSSWGSTSQELRIEALPNARGWFGAWYGVVPSILPAIQLPPFDDSLTAQVTVDSCLNVRSEPTTESDIEVCLPPGRVVELVAHPASGYVVEGPCFEDDAGPCVWVYVLTEDGEQGWAYSDFLRWPGTPLAVVEEEPASDEAAEG